MKRIICLGVILIMSLSLFFACNKNKDTTTWTNDNAVYVMVKAEYVQEVLKDVEGSFSQYSFKKIYVAGKKIEFPQITRLRLLFILNESGADKQKEFSDIMILDERVSLVRNCFDLPFETVDTRYLDAASDTIAVGDTLVITMMGSRREYDPPFEFDGLWVTSINGASRSYIKIAEPNYFNAIKRADTLSRSSTYSVVEFDPKKRITIPQPIWQISDRTIADFADGSNGVNHSQPVTIIGLRPGTVTVSLTGARREFTVVEN